MNEPVKLFRMVEVAKCNDSKQTYIVIHNSVYDLTAFLNEHPGGEEVLLDQAGKDGTEAFEDVGHSTDARNMMDKYKIGELVEEDRVETKVKPPVNWNTEKESNNSAWKSWIIPITLGVVATILYRSYFISQGH